MLDLKVARPWAGLVRIAPTVLNSYGKNVTVCQGRGAGVFCAVVESGFLQAGNCGAKKAGVTVWGKC
jgi:hypothetical protein